MTTTEEIVAIGTEGEIMVTEAEAEEVRVVTGEVAVAIENHGETTVAHAAETARKITNARAKRSTTSDRDHAQTE